MKVLSGAEGLHLGIQNCWRKGKRTEWRMHPVETCGEKKEWKSW
jgi:hypothetical protein